MAYTEPAPNTRIDAFSAEPDMLVLFRGFPKRAQHQFVQLAIDEMELDSLAERLADDFLAKSAWQIEDGNEDRASDLYPHSCTHRQTWLRHKVACAQALLQLERHSFGRAAMLMPRIRMSVSSAAD